MSEFRRNLAVLIADPLTPERLRQHVSEGDALEDLATAWKVPFGRLRSWIVQQGDLSEELQRARELYAHELALEALAIADETKLGVETTTKADGTVETKEADMLGHRKLQVETRLKLARSYMPKVYGEKGGLSVAGDAKITIIHESS